MGNGGIRFNRDFITNLRTNLKDLRETKGYMPNSVAEYYNGYVEKIQKLIGSVK